MFLLTWNLNCLRDLHPFQALGCVADDPKCSLSRPLRVIFPAEATIGGFAHSGTVYTTSTCGHRDRRT
jgi:hypothetical protein